MSRICHAWIRLRRRVRRVLRRAQAWTARQNLSGAGGLLLRWLLR